MSARPGAPRVLHLFGRFADDDPQSRRSVRLMDAFGGTLAHTIVAAHGGGVTSPRLAKGIEARLRRDFPRLGGIPMPGRLQSIARAMQDYDLVLTYGRGAIDAALAHTMFSKAHALPPLIHHEDGSDETTAQRRGLRSKWYRRLGLGKAAGLVVPTETMEHAALLHWQQPLGRVRTIRDGVDLKCFARAVKPDGIPRLRKRMGERWLGCHTPNDDAAALAKMAEWISRLPPQWHLILLGRPDNAASFADSVAAFGVDHRVHIASDATDRAVALKLFDLVMVAGGAEPLPLIAIEAMAAARPVVSEATPDMLAALSVDNADLLQRETAIGALDRLACDDHLREHIGIANREKAEAERDEASMIAAYRRLYFSAIGRDPI